MAMAILLILTIMVCKGVSGQSSCGSSTVLGLSPCINSVTGNGTSPPSTSCCASLASIVRSQPECLCPLLTAGGGLSFGVSINQTLAMALPALCGVQTPPVSRCNGVADGPATAPSTLGSPADGFTGPTASTVPSTSGNGSKKVPTTNGSTSDGTNLLLSSFQLITVLIAVSLFSI